MSTTCKYCAMVAKSLARQSLPTMAVPDLMWFTGLYEGEGSLYPFQSRGVRRWQLAISMTDQDVIEKVRKITGAGSVTSHVRSELHPEDDRKTIYQWRVCARVEITDLLDQIIPHLGARRAGRAREALVELREARCKRHRESDIALYGPESHADASDPLSGIVYPATG